MSIMHPKERCDINFSLILKETTTLIHAPARGATPVLFGFFQAFHFNPRTREECDVDADGGRIMIFTSIHAPARSATSKLPNI